MLEDVLELTQYDQYKVIIRKALGQQLLEHTKAHYGCRNKCT